jgi:macrolide-specific efflux system membrane fusion protein
MTRSKYRIIFLLTFLLIAAFLFFRYKENGQQNSLSSIRTVNPVIGDIVLTVSTTGVVEPQNRLEIKPSISGRIEEILVKEGDHLKSGDILAWMSSTERAALIDAARSQDRETLQYWEEVYKKSPIISPIDGEVIVRAVEPGQTVTTSDTVLVLSDRLIVNAQFDETDIGRVRVGQKAFIILDAYPDIRLDGVVDHIAYESEIVNNVTIYDVDVLLKKIPKMLRSGMSVSVEVIEETGRDVITIPSGAVHYDDKRPYVLVRNSRGETVERDITIGLQNEESIEITSGLTTDDLVIVQDMTYTPNKRNSGTSPFMPFGRKRR